MLIVVMLLSSFVSASTFSDVEVDGWSETYIDQVTNADIMPGYDDNTFMPEALVSKMEVINVIYRIALLKGEVTEEEVNEYLISYQSTIDGLLLPNQLEPYGANNHKAIAYALDRGIIRSSELSLFYVNGHFEMITKVDASVYMAKALNVYLQENVNKFYEIRYKDGSEITLMAWPYINLLIEKEIVSAAGNDGYFNPNSNLRRDVFSVIASGVLRELEGYNKETTDTETPTHTLSGSGTISIIHYDKNIIEIRDAYNRLKVYDASEAEITLNGDKITLQNLEAGTEVTIKYSGNKLTNIDIKEEHDMAKGTLSSVGVIQETADETYRLVVVKTADGFKYLKALNSSIIERDYQTSELDAIGKDENVTIYYDGYYLKKIVSFSDQVVLEGALERSSDFNAGDDVSIKLFNDKLIEQVLEQNAVKINVNEDLIKGDIVKITMSNGQIVAVEATGLTTEATGRLVKIVISESPQLSLVNSKGVTKTFNVSKDVVVKNLGAIDELALYALRLDQDITVKLSGLSVNEIAINKAVEKIEFEATITEVHNNINLIKATDSDDKTWIISLEGSDENISDYAVGDKVYVYGVALSADLFEADLIIVLD